jgi:hypothetical protein
MPETTQEDLDKRIGIINRLIFDYSELRMIEKNETEKNRYGKTILLLNGQKLRIQEFQSSLT